METTSICLVFKLKFGEKLIGSNLPNTQNNNDAESRIGGTLWTRGGVRGQMHSFGESGHPVHLHPIEGPKGGSVSIGTGPEGSKPIPLWKL